LGFFFVTPAAVFPSNIVAGRLFSLAMNERRFPPPWSIEDDGACFIVKDSAGQKLAHVYFEDEPRRGVASCSRAIKRGGSR
jgi:hypothetical protein